MTTMENLSAPAHFVSAIESRRPDFVKTPAFVNHN
jgi:hypothetical protein